MIWKLAGAALAAASIAAASIAVAAAQPNPNSDNANDHAKERGISVAGVAGNGPRPVLGAIQGFAPDAAQNGLSSALSHVPTTTPVAAPTP